jgi:hypothetical protein
MILQKPRLNLLPKDNSVENLLQDMRCVDPIVALRYE